MMGRLRDLGIGARLGMSMLILVILGGLAASVSHLVFHHENRDEQPGLSVTDIEGAYHGTRTSAPLRTALERGHPEELGDTERDLLLEWLNSDRISDDYDNLDLGDFAPAEIIAVECLQCHGRSSADPIAKEYPLDYWTDIQGIAFSREVNPVDIKILAASTHTHAISLGVLSIVVSFLLLGTRLPRVIVGGLICLTAAALLADLGAWWLARSSSGLIWVIVVAGGLYNGGTAFMLLLTLADMWFPKKKTPQA